ncbi:MAG TPA: hypothetical protein EYN89_02130 [Flavobacteriales bacterium]|nr:hypothetical protein [Flavobacteriales bacterium]
MKSLFRLIFLIYAGCLPSYAQVYINEFMASNKTAYWDNDLKAYSDWIELYNAGNTIVDLNGYYITDNLKQSYKWMIPEGVIINPKGYILLWADRGAESNHLGFALNINKESIALYSPELLLVDLIKYSGQVPNISYGRCFDGGKDWGYFGEHTAGRSNGKGRGAINLKATPPPILSLEGGIYPLTTRLSIFHNQNVKIRFTTDGSDVKYDSPEYTEEMLLNSTTVIKAKAYQDGKLPSITVTSTYIIEQPRSMPVVSLVSDRSNLWDDEMGIYVNGNGYKDNYWRTANYQQFWHRPSHIEYFSHKEELSYAANTEMKVFGSFTSRYGQKPLTIYFQDEPFQKWKVFRSRGLAPYHSLVLRNSGQDWIRTMICDGLVNSLVIGALDLDAQAYRPSVVYLNGEYWGIYNIREKVNEEHFGNIYNIDPSRILLQKRLGSTGQEEVDSLISYVLTHDLRETAHLEYVKGRIDIDEYLNYLIAEFYSANMDWPKNNVRMWKKKGSNGKWRWILSDLDVSMGIWNNAQPDVNSISRLLDTATVNTELFRALMKNNDFKNDLIQRAALLLNTVFREVRVNHYIDSLSGDIGSEMPRHINRWKDSCSWSCGLGSMDDWENFLNKMRYFADKRPNMMRANINNKFELNGVIEIELKADNGRIVINNCDIPFDPSGTYFRDIPFHMTAIPDPGYQFNKWRGDLQGKKRSTTVTLSKSAYIEAVFQPTDHIALPKRIKEDTYLSNTGQPYYVDDDLIVDSGVILSISNGVTVLMQDNADIVVYGGLEVQGSAGSPAVIQANQFTGSERWGALCFENASEKNVLKYLVLKDATHGNDKDRYLAAINAYHSDLEMDECIVNQVYGQPVYAEYGHVEIRNSTMQTHVSSDIINLKYGSGLVENCDLRGNKEPETDGIDFDGITNGIIRGNHIYDFRGFNSDGIDLGEGSTDVLIEDNRISNCYDKGISVGQGSTTRIFHNVITECNQGVGVKDSNSFADIDKTIFYKNNIGIACFEKNYGMGGGTANILNTVISNSVSMSVYKDKLSRLEISYSLSDLDILKGRGNAYESPRFINPEAGDFSVFDNSPCLNYGENFSVLALEETRKYQDRVLNRKKIDRSLLIMLTIFLFIVIVSSELPLNRLR